MPTETKNRTANASCSGSEFSAAWWLSSVSASTTPAKNAPSANETSNRSSRAIRDAERDSQHCQREQLARTGACDVVQNPRDDAPAADQHQRDEHRDLERGHRQPGQQRARIGTALGSQRRQEHQCEDHREVLDDQPADGDVAVLRVELVALLERAQQYDRTCDRQRQAEYQPGGQAPSPPARKRRADPRCDCDLRNGTGQGDGAHAQQRRHRKVQADTEHQQDHADFGELGGEVGIGDESRRERADRDARQQVADERRQAHSRGEKPEGECEHETDSDERDEFGFVWHGALCWSAGTAL